MSFSLNIYTCFVILIRNDVDLFNLFLSQVNETISNYKLSNCKIGKNCRKMSEMLRTLQESVRGRQLPDGAEEPLLQGPGAAHDNVQ